MGTVIEMIPNAFWSALNNQNLADLLPPRWSILVNDAGVQCTLYWESTDAAPPSPPPSPDPIQSKGMMRTKRHATQQMAMAAKRIRPNPSRFGNFGLIPPRNPLIQINPQQFEGVKKFDGLGGHGLPGLDPDVSRQNALSNLSQALQVEFQNQTRNIIRLNNHTSSKSSTPHTETPTPKSVIHPAESMHPASLMANKEVVDEGEDLNGASDLSRRNSVVTENNVLDHNDPEKEQQQQLNSRNNEDGANIDNKVNGGYPIEDMHNAAGTAAAANDDEHQRIANDDDLNLEEVMKQRTSSISSIVQDAAHAAIVQAQQNSQQQQQQPLSNAIQQPQQGQTTPTLSHQHSQQQAQNNPLTAGQPIEPQRSQADVLKDNLANMKEEMDSDCELVENDEMSHNGKNGSHGLPNLGISNRGIVRPPLTFDPPGSIQRPSIGTINLPGAFGLDAQRQNSSSSQLVPRGGPLPYNKCPLTSVDKLAEQNGHKAELQALRQEANRGDEIHTGYRII